MALREVEVYGHRLLVEHTADGWRTFTPGADGKRSPHGASVPAFVVSEDDLLQYLADLSHESARPDRQIVRWVR